MPVTHSLNVSAVRVGYRARREYLGGSKSRPVFAARYVRQWKALFEIFRRRHVMECEVMLAKYESRVNEYGYSLLDFNNITAAAKLDHIRIRL